MLKVWPIIFPSGVVLTSLFAGHEGCWISMSDEGGARF